jgi:hypothetical protein
MKERQILLDKMGNEGKNEERDGRSEQVRNEEGWKISARTEGEQSGGYVARNYLEGTKAG